MAEDGQIRTVSQLGQWHGGGTPSKAVASYWDGDIPWVSPKDMTGGAIRDTLDRLTKAGAATLELHPPGAIAVVFRSGILRRAFPVARGAVPFTVNQDLKVLHPGPKVDAGYAFHVLRGLERRVVGSAVKSGTTVESVDSAVFYQMPVYVPQLVEQRAIAEILDTVDEAIHSTEQLIAKLERMQEGLLNDLLTRGVGENGELRDPERHPELFKHAALGWVPRQWDVQPFGQITHSALLGTGVRGVDPLGDNLNLLKMGNLGWGLIDVADIEPVARGRVPDWPDLVLEHGDLLFNTRNTPALVGKTVAWRASLGKETIADNNILRVRFDGRANGQFIAAYMAHGEGRRRVGQLATGTTSVAAVYWKSLRRFRVPLPPRAEQDEIVVRVRGIEELVTAENGVLRKLRLLNGGVAQDLLTGRVRVTGLLEGDAA